MNKMQGIVTRIGALFVALVLVCGVSACGQTTGAQTSAQTSQPTESTDASTAGVSVEQIRERGKLLVGASGDYCPLCMRDSDGSYWGLDVDLAQDLADDLGVELAFVPTTWPTILDDAVAGSYDLALCGVSITDARLEKALMSDPYLDNGKTALMRAEDVDKYKTLDDINQPGVRVMENPGGTNEKLAKEWLPNADITIHEGNAEIPGLIAQGEADVMITETCEAGYYAGRDERLAAPLIDEPFSRGKIGALMNAGSEDLKDYVNDFLAREEASGRLDELREKYIYGDNGAEHGTELDLAA
jgi:cyclohexadienyl dehydratase